MPAQWTNELVGKMHGNITIKQLAQKLGMSHEYVGKVLNGKRDPKNAEQRFNDAFLSLISSGEEGRIRESELIAFEAAGRKSKEAQSDQNDAS